jgi:hypothetical protein
MTSHEVSAGSSAPTEIKAAPSLSEVQRSRTDGDETGVQQPPALNDTGREIALTGKFPKIASIKDEEWITPPLIEDPRSFIQTLRKSKSRADLFTFVEELGCSEPRFPEYQVEWDNAAVVPTTTFQDWWEKRLPQEARKNVRRSERRGLSVREVFLNDALIAGIKQIYDETPFRQGRRFHHYGKDLETIKRENSSYLDRSDFFGAFFQEQLVGFIKIVYIGQVGRIMQILSMNAHFDKRPPNALLAKAVERCCERKMKYFVYGKYIYGNKRNSPVTEFKRRTGFEELRFPRYYVPLTAKGKIALALGLHRGIQDMLPEPVTEFLLRLRAKIYALNDTGPAPSGTQPTGPE